MAEMLDLFDRHRGLDLPPIVELKRTLAGREKTFDCRLLAGHRRGAAALLVAAGPMHAHGVVLFAAGGPMHAPGARRPAGTRTFGHFWPDRFYNVSHWLDRRGGTIGFY